MTLDSIEFRRAQLDDHEGVRALCEGIWEDRGGDYLPKVFSDWYAGDDRQTIVAETADGTIAGIAQGVRLSEWEGWAQGLRVGEGYRRSGLGTALIDQLIEWANKQGLTVLRSMVYGWNEAGMAVARSAGFTVQTSVQLATLSRAAEPTSAGYRTDPDLAWMLWSQSDARDWCSGLMLDTDESWAMREATRADTVRGAGSAFTVHLDTGAGVAIRGRATGRDDTEQAPGQEYAAVAWTTEAAGDELFTAIAADAVDQGAQRVRIALPGVPKYVAEAAAAGATLDGPILYVFGVPVQNEN